MGDLGGSKIGGLGSLVTLGSGTSSKVIQRRVTWTAYGIGGGGWRKQAGHGGDVQEGAGVAATVGERGVATLGSSMATLGHPGDRTWPWFVGGGPRLCHDSNRSRRLAMASIWEMLVGGRASLRVPDMMWRPWMILSSREGEGMVQ
jgi:hypothetical protein